MKFSIYFKNFFKEKIFIIKYLNYETDTYKSTADKELEEKINLINGE